VVGGFGGERARVLSGALPGTAAHPETEHDAVLGLRLDEHFDLRAGALDAHLLGDTALFEGGLDREILAFERPHERLAVGGIAEVRGGGRVGKRGDVGDRVGTADGERVVARRTADPRADLGAVGAARLDEDLRFRAGALDAHLLGHAVGFERHVHGAPVGKELVFADAQGIRGAEARRRTFELARERKARLRASEIGTGDLGRNEVGVGHRGVATVVATDPRDDIRAVAGTAGHLNFDFRAGALEAHLLGDAVQFESDVQSRTALRNERQEAHILVFEFRPRSRGGGRFERLHERFAQGARGEVGGFGRGREVQNDLVGRRRVVAADPARHHGAAVVLNGREDFDLGARAHDAHLLRDAVHREGEARREAARMDHAARR